MVRLSGVSLDDCIAAYNLIAEAGDYVPLPPAIQEVLDNGRRTVQEAFDALESLANNDCFWRQFPREFAPTARELDKAKELALKMCRLSTLNFDEHGNQISQDESYAKCEASIENLGRSVKTKDEFRQGFYDLLGDVSKL